MSGIKVIQSSNSQISYRDYNSSPSACQQETDLPLSAAMPAAGEQPVEKCEETPLFPAVEQFLRDYSPKPT